MSDHPPPVTTERIAEIACHFHAGPPEDEGHYHIDGCYHDREAVGICTNAALVDALAYIEQERVRGVDFAHRIAEGDQRNAEVRRTWEEKLIKERDEARSKLATLRQQLETALRA